MSHERNRGRGRARAFVPGVLAGALAAGVGAVAPVPAQAQMAVIDVSAIRQLVAQIGFWRQQIEAMGEQLTQLRDEYEAITGTRGMEDLVPISVRERNYLPAAWQDVAEVLEGVSAEYGALSADVQALIEDAAVLPEEVLGLLQPTHRELLESGRQIAAMAQALSREAYGETSLRYAQIDALRAAIREAEDPKAIADLSARIASEEAMLANDQVRLQALQQMTEGEARMQAERTREAAIAGIGSIEELAPVEY